MIFIVFGDLHINKRFNSLYIWYENDWYFEGIRRYVTEIVDKYKGKEGIVCFLGDLHDYNKKEEQYYSKFNQLVQMLRKKGWIVVVTLGNHDSGSSYNLYNAHVVQYTEGALYTFSPTIIYNNKDITIVSLPYTSRENVTKWIYDVYKRNDLAHKQKVILFSHNNIYIEDYFYDTYMINFGLIRKHFPNVILVNGHIHRFYAEEGYYQIGSANPTSFKERPNAVGCVVYDTFNNSFKLYKNTHLLFASINSIDYIEEMHRFLRKADENGSMVYLGIREGMLDVEKEFGSYKCAVGVEWL